MTRTRCCRPLRWCVPVTNAWATHLVAEPRPPCCARAGPRHPAGLPRRRPAAPAQVAEAKASPPIFEETAHESQSAGQLRLPRDHPRRFTAASSPGSGERSGGRLGLPSGTATIFKPVNLVNALTETNSALPPRPPCPCAPIPSGCTSWQSPSITAATRRVKCRRKSS